MAIQSTNPLNTSQTVASIFNPPVTTTRGNEPRDNQSQSNGGSGGGEQRKQQEALIRHSSQGVQKLEAQRNGAFADHLAQEGIDQRSTKAVNAYQSLANMDQRQEIQSMLGVDVYV